MNVNMRKETICKKMRLGRRMNYVNFMCSVGFVIVNTVNAGKYELIWRLGGMDNLKLGKSVDHLKQT